MKQINLYLIPNWFKWLGWIIAIFLLLLLKKCESESKLITVITPEIKSNFRAKKPNHVEIMPKIVHIKEDVYKKGEKVYIKNPINEKLITENKKLKEDFAKENDSIKKLSFEKAIKLNNFSTNFEDKNIVININGIVRGEIQEIAPSYTIKEKTVEVTVKQKQTVFRVLVGGAFGINKDLNQPVYQADINFQNKKGNIISAEYLNIANQNYILVGYKVSILNIKK